MVTLQMIQEAQESLKGIARKTPLENANRLGENIYIKSENRSSPALSRSAAPTTRSVP